MTSAFTGRRGAGPVGILLRQEDTRVMYPPINVTLPCFGKGKYLLRMLWVEGDVIVKRSVNGYQKVYSSKPPTETPLLKFPFIHLYRKKDCKTVWPFFRF